MIESRLAQVDRDPDRLSVFQEMDACLVQLTSEWPTESEFDVQPDPKTQLDRLPQLLQASRDQLEALEKALEPTASQILNFGTHLTRLEMSQNQLESIQQVVTFMSMGDLSKENLSQLTTPLSLQAVGKLKQLWPTDAHIQAFVLAQENLFFQTLEDHPETARDLTQQYLSISAFAPFHPFAEHMIQHEFVTKNRQQFPKIEDTFPTLDDFQHWLGALEQQLRLWTQVWDKTTQLRCPKGLFDDLVLDHEGFGLRGVLTAFEQWHDLASSLVHQRHFCMYFSQTCALLCHKATFLHESPLLRQRWQELMNPVKRIYSTCERLVLQHRLQEYSSSNMSNNGNLRNPQSFITLHEESHHRLVQVFPSKDDSLSTHVTSSVMVLCDVLEHQYFVTIFDEFVSLQSDVRSFVETSSLSALRASAQKIVRELAAVGLYLGHFIETFEALDGYLIELQPVLDLDRVERRVMGLRETLAQDLHSTLASLVTVILDFVFHTYLPNLQSVEDFQLPKGRYFMLTYSDIHTYSDSPIQLIYHYS